MPHSLRTERLLLRPPTVRDGAALARAVNDRAVLRYTGTWSYPASAEYARFRIASASGFIPSVHQSFLVIHGTEVIGQCGVGQREGEGFEIGYMIGRAWWGQGFMTEAVRALCAHTFRTMPAKSLWGGVFDDNPASKRVLEKLGFAYRGPSAPVWSIVRGRSDPGSDYELIRERFRP